MASSWVSARSNREFAFLIAEAVLRWPLGGDQVLAAQPDRIVSLARLDVVEVAVLPTTVTRAAVWHNFILWDIDDEAGFVTAELIDGEHEVRQSDRVDLYEAMWSRLWSESVAGADAVELIRRVAH